jgi:hypothetical protein
MSEMAPSAGSSRRDRAVDGFIAGYVRELLADEDAPAAMPAEPNPVELERPGAGVLDDTAIV